jgi:competence protein ComEC
VRLGGRPFGSARRDSDPVRTWLRGSSEGLAAGLAATIPTLPLLAWHFDRASILGVLATLVVAPGVSLAIPGIIGTLVLSTVAPGLAGVMAGGVGWILEAVALGVRVAAAVPGAAPWVSRPALIVGGGGAALFLLVASHFRLPGLSRVRMPVRGLLSIGAGLGLVILLPLIPVSRGLELHVLDVGQGEAIAVRFPRGGWMLVDAGPASPGWDAGARVVLPYLRRHGVRRLEALVLTHAHLDHVGGAPAILRSLKVRGILEPGRVTPSAAYLETLRAAGAQGSSWWQARAGTRLHVEGVGVRVLFPGPPDPADPPAGPAGDPNRVSVVILIEWGEAAVLLTGDAYAPTERMVLGDLPRLTVLKLGHHGSRTSTSPALLARTRPTLAVASLADGNRYGHPHPEVLVRLSEAEVPLLRTDRDGHIRIRMDRQGRVVVKGVQ